LICRLICRLSDLLIDLMIYLLIKRLTNGQISGPVGAHANAPLGGAGPTGPRQEQPGAQDHTPPP